MGRWRYTVQVKMGRWRYTVQVKIAGGGILYRSK